MTRNPKTIVALCYGLMEEYRYHVKPGTQTISVPVCALPRMVTLEEASFLAGLGHPVKEFHYQKIGVDQGKAIFVR